jgi:Na+-transporting NADH:ubiquinone oxidoreductase subunit NqrD
MFKHNSGTPGAISTKLGTNITICMSKNLMCVCSSITLERLERFQPNLVHRLLYVCLRILRVFVRA